MPAEPSLYATCAAGLQHLLADELKKLGAASVSTAGSGVRFASDLSMAYKACLWSRVANRILLPIHSGAAASPEELYSLAQEINWADHMALEGTLAVDFFTANSAITHSQYGALKVKDAIVDQFRERTGMRPNVERETPDLRVNVYLFRDKARFAIDLSGSSLHRRGYREQAGPAPLKENLAAALLLASDWPERVAKGQSFHDPLCGSGTLAIEAALIACQRAPGLDRSHFGFTGWKQHDSTIWNKILAEAKDALVPAPISIRGTDKDTRAIELARVNAQLAGVADAVEFDSKDLFSGSLTVASANGLVLSNPPYGERLETDAGFYTELGEQLSRQFAGWDCGLFTAKQAPIKHTRLPLSSGLEAKNGSIECVLLVGSIPGLTGKTASRSPAVNTAVASEHVDEAAQAATAKADHTIDINPFENRLRKNIKKLKAWRKREQIQALRIYDADMPEFAVAIDIYDCDDRHVVVQEYQAPATVNSSMAKARLSAIMECLPVALGVDAERIHLKVREKKTGLSQYEKQGSRKVIGMLHEHEYVLECNFSDYLDTGLFLDHRKVRRFIGEQANGKRFLNLFSYTGAATVSAVAGGAAETVSVDLSKKYCEWLGRNLIHNKMDQAAHRIVRADVSKWLADYNGDSFDLILLDPPTFSNSTGVDADWNVQRDHVACIDGCMKLLAPAGVLIFSNNYQRFKLDESLGAIQGGNRDENTGQYNIEDRSRWSIDKDFERNSRIHQCWFITHK